MKFATAFGLLQIALASSGVAGASPSVGLRGGAAADAPEPQQPRRLDESFFDVTFKVTPANKDKPVGWEAYNGCINDPTTLYLEPGARGFAFGQTEVPLRYAPDTTFELDTNDWLRESNGSPFLKVKLHEAASYTHKFMNQPTFKRMICKEPEEQEDGTVKCMSTIIMGYARLCPVHIALLNERMKYAQAQECFDNMAQKKTIPLGDSIETCNEEARAYGLASRALHGAKTEVERLLDLDVDRACQVASSKWCTEEEGFRERTLAMMAAIEEKTMDDETIWQDWTGGDAETGEGSGGDAPTPDAPTRPAPIDQPEETIDNPTWLAPIGKPEETMYIDKPEETIDAPTRPAPIDQPEDDNPTWLAPIGKPEETIDNLPEETIDNPTRPAPIDDPEETEGAGGLDLSDLDLEEDPEPNPNEKKEGVKGGDKQDALLPAPIDDPEETGGAGGLDLSDLGGLDPDTRF